MKNYKISIKQKTILSVKKVIKLQKIIQSKKYLKIILHMKIRKKYLMFKFIHNKINNNFHQ